MNPLDLRGPEFLAFYLLVVGLVAGALWALRRSHEGGLVPRLDVSDPFLLAFLRGGNAEMVRIALFSLVDRGLLTLSPSGAELSLADPQAPEKVRRPFERALLLRFTQPRPAAKVLNESSLATDDLGYQATLETLGLLPDPAQKARRFLLFALGALALGGLAATKVLVALSRGHSNVGFLILLAVGALILLASILFPRRTTLGSWALQDIQNLTQPLRNRAATLQPGGGTAEAVLLAAVFGLSSLPTSTFAYLKTLFPVANSSSTSGCGSSCGSSCGGGCGGGCGGCGS